MGSGRMIDPYRPTIQPGGFACLEELRGDRRQHLAAVRRMVEELDVLVFTLGLTETWYAKADGAVYPICPGVSGGSFDPTRHGFMNQRVGEVIGDLTETIGLIRTRNPRARFILTVSPVPLIATMEDRSVLVSTTYSKSALRVAAEDVAATHEGVSYFPSYEIITGNYTRGAYFAGDMREVTEAGVEHVMRLFLKHYTNFAEETLSLALPETKAPQPASGGMRVALEEAVAVLCDELLLDTAEESPSRPMASTHRTDPTETRDARPAPASSTQPAPVAIPASAWDTFKSPLPATMTQVSQEPTSEQRRSHFSWFKRLR